MVPVIHQVMTNTGYLQVTVMEDWRLEVGQTDWTHQGMKEVITPKIILVTELAQMATFLPYLSDTRPEQKEPRANPVKRIILARVLSQAL